MGAVVRFRFTGQYTHGRTSISLNGVEFTGREPSEVPPEQAWRFELHPEFEAAPLEVEATPTSAPVRRKRKANR
jgi:hypothetical protein